MKNYYKVLQLDKKASPEEIKNSFRRLSKKMHPDVNGGAEKSLEAFHELLEANDVLSNVEKKEMYDAVLQYHAQQRKNKLKKVGLIVCFIALVVSVILSSREKNSAFEIVEDLGVPQLNISETQKGVGILNKIPPRESEPKPDVLEPEVETQSSISEPTTPVSENKTETALVQRPSVEEKTLSTEDISRILDEINLKKGAGSTVNCIQVRRTANSNVTNWLLLPTVLQQKGFAISGREIVKKQISGIEIVRDGDCIKLTIGSL